MSKIVQQAASQWDSDNRPWKDNPVFSAKLADVAVDALALEFTELRVKGAFEAGGNAGALSSLTKVMGTEIGQRFNELSVEIMGEHTLVKQLDALQPDYKGGSIGPDCGLTTMAEYINNRASTIYGGSAEIQRDIIAKRVLRL